MLEQSLEQKAQASLEEEMIEFEPEEEVLEQDE